MSELRAAKSGIARDVQQKIAGKYDQDVAAKCMEWLAQVTGERLDTSGDMKKVYEQLKDGYVLQLFISKFPGKPANPKRPKMAFQQMEAIEKFTVFIKGPPLNTAEHAVFATPDLYEMQNMVQVITCLEAVARRCLNTPGCPVPGFGPKESETNKREFTEEQLAQGKSIIGLQMGSNKGATQAGQNFGKSRMIVD